MLVLFFEMSIFYYSKNKHKICYFNHFKMYNLVAWSTPTVLGNHHRHPSPPPFISQTGAMCPLSKPPMLPITANTVVYHVLLGNCTTHAPPPPPDNPYFTFSVSLPIPGTSYKWNQTVSVFCEWHTPHFVYPFTCWWTCRCFCLWTMFVYNSVLVGVE